MGHANLVVTRAGPRSLHAAWRPLPGPRSFDLLVASYCEEAEHPMADGVMQTFVPGRKVEGWDVVLGRCAEVVVRYDRVALIDDDILAGADAIGRCFAAGAEQRLSIWQPSLSWDSYFTYAGTLHNPMFALRYVNVVEMMCPFFSAEALQRVKPLFGYGWESGIDLVWCSLLPRRPRQFAILDDVVVRHTRPVGALKQANGFVGRDYEDDIHACLRHFPRTRLGARSPKNDPRFVSWPAGECRLRARHPARHHADRLARDRVRARLARSRCLHGGRTHAGNQLPGRELRLAGGHGHAGYSGRVVYRSRWGSSGSRRLVTTDGRERQTRAAL